MNGAPSSEPPPCTYCEGQGRIPTCLYDAVRVENGARLEAPYGVPCPRCDGTGRRDLDRERRLEAVRGKTLF
jgi:RecJ-like exonuclease